MTKFPPFRNVLKIYYMKVMSECDILTSYDQVSSLLST